MIDLNIIYTDHSARSLEHETTRGRVWMSPARQDGMANIAMNSYSAIGVLPNDSIFIAEPLCVLEQNYNINFLKQFRYIFTWATKAFAGTEIEHKVIYTNFPSYKGNPHVQTAGWADWPSRSDEIVFIANNKSARHPSELYSLRLKLADWLHSNSRFKVSWYGNMPVRRPYFRGNVTNKSDALRHAKFHVCMENSYDPIYSANFLTEKLPDAWLSGTVPIYMGCSNLAELGIPESCYINMIPFKENFASLEAYLVGFSETNYNQIIWGAGELSDRLHQLTSYENLYNIILNAYGK